MKKLFIAGVIFAFSLIVEAGPGQATLPHDHSSLYKGGPINDAALEWDDGAGFEMSLLPYDGESGGELSITYGDGENTYTYNFGVSSGLYIDDGSIYLEGNAGYLRAGDGTLSAYVDGESGVRVEGANSDQGVRVQNSLNNQYSLQHYDGFEVYAGVAGLRMHSISANSGERNWQLNANGLGEMWWRACSDDGTTCNTFFEVNRSGNYADAIELCDPAAAIPCSEVVVNADSLVLNDGTSISTIPADFYSSGNFTASTEGCASEISVDVYWQKVGDWATITVYSDTVFQCTSDTNIFRIDSSPVMPAGLIPSVTNSDGAAFGVMIDNGLNASDVFASVNSTGDIVLSRGGNAINTWSSSGTKGFSSSGDAYTLAFRID